jgi:mono/diheme cytochrome c family protein
MKIVIKLSAAGLIVLLSIFLWAPAASAFPGFDDGGGAGLPACAGCHGNDGSGGRVGEGVRGEDGSEIMEAVYD